MRVVLKFQFNCACFQGGEANANFGGKWNKKKERKKMRTEHH